MGVVKVVVNGVTKMDITPTTADASEVNQGEVFFNRSGEQTVGTGAVERFSGMDLDSASLSSGNTLTITFPSTGSRANGLISITGSSAARTALYAFSGLNGATPSVTKLSGGDLDSLFSTASGSISFTPNYGAFVMILSINNSGHIDIS